MHQEKRSGVLSRFRRLGQSERSETGAGERPARAGQPQQTRVVVLIDAENALASKIGDILAEAEAIGQLVSARIYGPWGILGSEACLKAMESTILKPVVCKGCVGGKNSVDIRMVVDAMDALAADAADVFVVASGDSDFLPLIERMHQAGKMVVGIGCSVTNTKYADACDRFVMMGETKKAKAAKKKAAAEKAIAKKATAKQDATAPKELAVAPEPVPDGISDKDAAIMREGIASNAGADGWCAVSKFAKWMQKRRPKMYPKRYGKSSYHGLLGALPGVTVVKRRGGEGYFARVTDDASANASAGDSARLQELVLRPAPEVEIVVSPSKHKDLLQIRAQEKALVAR